MNKGIRTVIEITDAHIKILCSEKVRGKNVIKACLVRQIVCHSDEAIAEQLRDMVASVPVGSGECIALVPRRWVILRQMRLPSHNDSEILDMIGLQMINNIPYPCEDIIFHYHLLDQDREGYSRVLAALLHKEVGQRYCRFLQKAGIKDGKMTLSSLGVLGWLVYQEGVHKSINGRPAVLVNIDSHHTEMCYCHNKRLFFSRNIPCGEGLLASEGSAGLMDHIRSSLVIYQREELGPMPEKVLIFSSAGEKTISQEHFDEILGVPVKVFGSLGDIPCVPAIHKEIVQAQRSCSLMAGMGMLFSDAKQLINLTPREICTAKEIRARRGQLTKFGCLLFITGVLVISGRFADIRQKETRLKSLEDELDRLRPRSERAGQKIQSVEFFDQKLKHHCFIPDMINEFNRLTPAGISFRALSLDKQGFLTVQGYARTHAGINDFQRRLIRSSRFHNVDLKFATKRKINNIDVMDFKIIFRLGDGKGGNV